jgi:hypothetical protein
VPITRELADELKELAKRLEVTRNAVGYIDTLVQR